jgi:hypothetical protein
MLKMGEWRHNVCVVAIGLVDLIAFQGFCAAREHRQV